MIDPDTEPEPDVPDPEMMEPEITGQIFMGAGDHSLCQMQHLHRLLEKSFRILGGIQQPPSPHEPEEACEQHMQDIEKGQAELKQIAGEIYLALTGETPKE